MQGDVALANQILEHGQIALDRFNKMRKDALLVVQGIKGYAKSYKPEYLLALKKTYLTVSQLALCSGETY